MDEMLRGVILFYLMGMLTLAGGRVQAQNFAKNTTRQVDKIKWYSLDEVNELQKTNPRKILIDLYTDWCGWCKVMDKNTFSNDAIIQYVNKTFYPVKLNAENRDNISFNNKQYNFISGKGRGYNEFALELTGGRLSYPSIIFIDENMNIIQPIQGYQEPKSFLMISKYFGENKYKDTPWSLYEQEYKSESERVRK